jgi:hypothetical protein
MTDKNDRKREREGTQNRALILSIVRSMGEVTWRMILPSILLVPLGLWADLRFKTVPWLTLGGLVVGLGLSITLVRQQLRGAQ